MTISLCMICRDNEDTIETALKSAVGVFDEIIICDTGSTDRTLEIVKRYTDKIARITWEDDFAKARNYSLDMATGDLIFYMDSDDELPEDTRQAIRIIAANNDKNVAYQFKIHNIFNDDFAKGWINDFSHLKLFPNRKDIRFNNKAAGHLHESVVDSIMKLKIEIRAVDYSVIHHGYETTERLDEKINRDIRLSMNQAGRYYQFRIEDCYFAYVNNFLTLWACTDANGVFSRMDYGGGLCIGNAYQTEKELDAIDLIRIYGVASSMYNNYKSSMQNSTAMVEAEIMRMEKNFEGMRIKNLSVVN